MKELQKVKGGFFFFFLRWLFERKTGPWILVVAVLCGEAGVGFGAGASVPERISLPAQHSLSALI